MGEKTPAQELSELVLDSSFGKLALEPAYIYDIRREEVYVDGKRILASNPLSTNPAQ
jgi:hypothetical protein